MILPLGLGLKIFRLPFVTLILIAANIIWYYHEGPIQTKFLEDIHAKHPVAKYEYELFKEFCRKKLGINSCQIGLELIHQKYLGLWPEDLSFYSTPSEKQTLTWKEFQLHLQQNFKHLNEYDQELLDQYILVKTKFEKKINESYKDQLIFSKNTFSLKALMLNQFRHGSSLHLYSNLFFLLSFGIYAECALGSFVFLLIYLLGGTIGLSLNAISFENNLTFIVGASANVSAIMGAFYVLFFRHYFKALLFMGVYFRVFLAPVSYTLPILFFSQDLIGILELERTNVAHLAHLGGLITGIIFTYIYKYLHLEIPEPFIYEYEFEKTMEVLNPNKNVNIISEANHLVEVNPLNYAVKERAINHSYRINHSHPEFIQAKYFIKNYFCSLVMFYFRNKKFDKIYNQINLFPPKYSFFDSVNKLDLKVIGKLINHKSEKNVPYTQVLLISSYLNIGKSKKLKNRNKIKEKLKAILIESTLSQEQLEAIHSFNDKYKYKNDEINSIVSESMKVNFMIA